MTWLSLLPPIVVFIMGFTTKRISLSLFIGVITAAAISTQFTPIETVTVITEGLTNNIVKPSNFFILSFVLFLGIIIEIIRHSHAATAFVDFAESSIKNKKSAETATLALAHCLSIDDYLSSLTVGSVMRPLTDRFNIARVKLAFLTDSMSAPLAMLTPVSSWAAAIIGFLTENGVNSLIENETMLHENPYKVYLNTLPYIFYSISLIIAVWVIVRYRLSYGLMHSHEIIADQTGNLAGGKPLGDHHTPPISNKGHHATFVDFLVPIVTLMASTLIFILLLGGSSLLGGNNNILETIQNAPISKVLFFSGLSALTVSFFYFLAKKTFNLKEMSIVIWHGFKLMFPVALILLFSWTMGDLLRQNLKTGEWLASLFAGSIPIFLIPLILFFNATIISLSLGSSWATTAILLPIAIPMVFALMEVEAPAKLSQLPILLPVFGAILSGAVCGDHISLISETTIMATTSSLCDHMDHVKTQLFYSFPVFVGCSLAFLVSGFLLDIPPLFSLLICLAISIVTSLTLLVILHKKDKRKRLSASILQSNS